MKVTKYLSIPFFITVILFTATTLFAQVKIGTNPTTINAANNLEVEASTTGRKTSVDKTMGQVTIADGTQKIGRVFTSDGNGGGGWQAGIVFAGYASTQSVGEDNAGTPVNIISEFDSESGWNSATKEYTIPVAGYYSISFSGINFYTDDYITIRVYQAPPPVAVLYLDPTSGLVRRGNEVKGDGDVWTAESTRNFRSYIRRCSMEITGPRQEETIKG